MTIAPLPIKRTRTMTATEWTILLLLSAVWGGSFFFNAVAVQSLPPLTIVFARIALAAVALQIVCRMAGVRFGLSTPVLLAFAGMGLLNNAIPFTLIVWGQTQIASGLASILNATTPMFTVIVAHLATSDERIGPAKAAGIAAGFAGVAVMVGTDALSGLGGNVLAQLACLAAALSYGFAGVFGRRFVRLGVPPLATATGQLTASSLMLAPVWLLVDQPWDLAAPGIETIAAILGLALLCSAFAYVLFFRLLASAGATNLSLVTLLVPVSAILLGSLVLGEQLLPRHWAGMALIFAGLAAIDGRLFAGFRRPPAEA